MKIFIKLLALLMLTSFPTFFANANPENAPGYQKKSLEILDVSVVTSGTSATISWQTNFPSMGLLETSDTGHLDVKTGTRHSITIPLVAGSSFRIVAVSERYGVDIYEGSLP